MLFDHIILAAGWLFFCFLHSLLAALWFKEYIKRWIGDRYFKFYRLAYSIFAFIMLTIVLVFQFSINSLLLFSRNLPVWITGILFSLTGVCIMTACIKKYFMNLSGVDVLTKRYRSQVLEENGLHGYVRHPLYTGTLLFVWALFILFPYLHNLLACVVITVYTLIGIGMEERKLVIEFGESYRRYSKKIPMLIPSLPKFRGKRL